LRKLWIFNKFLGRNWYYLQVITN